MIFSKKQTIPQPTPNLVEEYIKSQTDLCLQQKGFLIITQSGVKIYEKEKIRRFLENEKQKADAVKQEIKPNASISISETVKVSLMEKVIRSTCAAVALLCIGVSANQSLGFTSLFFTFPFNWIVSIAVPLYSSFSLEAAALVRKHSKKLSFGLVLLMVFSLGYEVLGVTINQYNIRIQKQNVEVEQKVKETTAGNVLDQLIVEKEKKVSDLEEAKNELQKEQLKLDGFSEKDSQGLTWAYREQRGYRDRARQKRDRLQEEIDKIDLQIKEQKTAGAIETGKKERKLDAYQWISTTLHLDVGLVEFGLFLLLALFLIVVAPVGVYVALGMWKKGEK